MRVKISSHPPPSFYAQTPYDISMDQIANGGSEWETARTHSEERVLHTGWSDESDTILVQDGVTGQVCQLRASLDQGSKVRKVEIRYFGIGVGLECESDHRHSQIDRMTSGGALRRAGRQSIVASCQGYFKRIANLSNTCNCDRFLMCQGNGKRVGEVQE